MKSIPDLEKLANGEKYVGDFKDGKRTGQGTLTWPSGDKYVGGFKDDKKNGQGTLTYPNGDKYVGEWKDDKKDTSYAGLIIGQGTYTYENGDEYVGGWKDDKKNGQGTFTYPDGSKYVAFFKDGDFNGPITYKPINGDEHFVEWKDGKIRYVKSFNFDTTGLTWFFDLNRMLKPYNDLLKQYAPSLDVKKLLTKYLVIVTLASIFVAIVVAIWDMVFY